MSSRRRKKLSEPPLPLEGRTAETITVAWMLATMTCLMCEVGVVALRVYLGFVPRREAGQTKLLEGFLSFSALAIGLVALLLLPLALKLRSSAPPRGVTIFAFLVSAAPLAGVFYKLLR